MQEKNKLKEFLINEDVVFVEGVKNAAIYDLKKEHVFALNKESKEILNNYLDGKDVKNSKFIEELLSKELVNLKFNPRPYICDSIKNKLNFVWLEITQTCNLKCIHCYEGKTHIAKNDAIDIEDWKRIIKEIYESGCKNIQLIGGEPTCYKNVVELINFVKSFQFERIEYFTNLTMLSKELESALSDNRIIVRVSIYGHNSQVHDKITQVKGSFELTIKNIERLQKLRVKILPSITLMKENQNQLKKIKKFLRKKSLQYNGFDMIRPVKNGDQDKHKITNKKIIFMNCRIKPGFVISKDWFNKSHQSNTCWFGKFAITENGDVIPCVFERDIKYGNIKEKSVGDLIKGESLKKYWGLDVNKLDVCSKCEFRYACKDCRALAYAMCGDINAKIPRCSYSPESGVWKINKEVKKWLL